MALHTHRVVNERYGAQACKMHRVTKSRIRHRVSFRVEYVETSVTDSVILGAFWGWDRTSATHTYALRAELLVHAYGFPPPATGCRSGSRVYTYDTHSHSGSVQTVQ